MGGLAIRVLLYPALNLVLSDLLIFRCDLSQTSSAGAGVVRNITIRDAERRLCGEDQDCGSCSMRAAIHLDQDAPVWALRRWPHVLQGDFTGICRHLPFAAECDGFSAAGEFIIAIC
jgi:hypothetical protein